jgi:antitoxin VapB
MTTTTAAVFMSGNSQAIRLPKSFRVNTSRVNLKRVGNSIVITEKPATMQDLLDKLPIIPDAPFAPEDGPEEPVEPW